jgi:serine protease Do
MNTIGSKTLIAALLACAGALSTPVASAAAPVTPPAVTGLPDFTNLIDAVGPAVVNIRTTEKARTGQGGASDEEMQEFLRRFFGAPIPRGQGPRGRRGPEEDVARGVGSGFIISNDGYILTNAHVVAGADDVLVTLTDRREFKAKVLGADRRSDVALLKVSAANLPYLRTGDSSKIRVGEWVIAIGSPFNLDNTVTAGIISAKSRDTGEFLPLIQSDVAVNPGNSGGPLINMRGEVIGINSQIYSRSGGFMGISFAIPIDEATRVAEQLRTSGKVSRGRIGVQIDQVTRDVAESIGLGKPQGALVRSVESGSPADKAGVEAGDIITKFNGQTIDRATDLPRLVGNTKAGSKVNLSVFRRGAARDLSVTVAELEPEKAPVRRTSTAEEKPKSSPAAQSIGLVVSELTEAQKKDLKLKGGVKVDAVAEGSARAGIREGDIIVAIGNTEVSTVREFDAVVAKVDKAKPIPVLLRRGELATYLLIRPARG